MLTFVVDRAVLRRHTAMLSARAVPYSPKRAAGFDALMTVYCTVIAALMLAMFGLVPGLGYNFFFNAPGHPLNGPYQTLPLLVLCIIVHFYTTGHLTVVTALKVLDGEFEAVSASLKVPFFKTFWRVTLPICMPILLDIARYFLSLR